MKKKLNNPFLLSGYWSREYFCDRENELNWVDDNYRNERNIVLYSWRRLGKTALIQCFFQVLEKQKKCETVYIDLLGTRDMPSALKSITMAVYESLGQSGKGISSAFSRLLSNIGISVSFDTITGTPKLEFSWVNPPIPESSLHAIGEFISNRKKQVVIVLDEFQQVIHYPKGTAEANFRSWMQTFPDIRFIFSGSHRNMMRSIFTEQNRPFYRSTQLLELTPIPENLYRPFIQSHFQQHKKQISEDIIHELYTWSRGQTYCIQLICNKLFGSCTMVRHSDLTRVYQEIIEQEKPIFANYIKILTVKQWELFKAIAKEEPLTNPLSEKFIGKYKIGTTSTVSTALKALQQKELVIEQEKIFFVHDVLLSRWLHTL